MQLVWFKRDLRLSDHQPFYQACQTGPVLALYVIEPVLWSRPDRSKRHYLFLLSALKQLDQSLRQLGGQLIIRVGQVATVFSDIHRVYGIDKVWAHEETGCHWTYDRDVMVEKWLISKDIPYETSRQMGVFRGLKNRDAWLDLWHAFMAQAEYDISGLNMHFFQGVISDPYPEPTELDLDDDGLIDSQLGGHLDAMRCLEHFLNRSSLYYSGSISSPSRSFYGCSRLSAYLSLGTISIRQVYRRAQKRLSGLKVSHDLSYEVKQRWLKSLAAFVSRLYWHDHFIQKLETDFRLEYKNMHGAYDHVRHDSWNEAYYMAWQKGMTGFPLVDAAMRSLIATGWLNFRMRAMLISFASAHLWLDWRKTAPYLATLFLDYEPGIHYPQVQMQSGTTGMNTIRIYNPTKQAMDHDPKGVFIRKWLPELRDIPLDFLFEPWKWPQKAKNYPDPIVDEVIARKSAQKKLYDLRKTSEHRQEKSILVAKHASRKKHTFKKIVRPSRGQQVGHPKQGDLFS